MTNAAVDNTLSLLDQGSFLWVQASGHVHCIQSTWIYRRAVDLTGLHRTQHNLAHGLLGRRIECSPLPFGRHRWISWSTPPAIDVAPPARTPAALSGWVDERAQVPIDPQRGPSWHIGVLPIEGFGAAVSLVVSHTVIDGMGLCAALGDAVRGHTADLGYPPPAARQRWRAVAQDARTTARGLPEVGRALIAGTKVARSARKNADTDPVAPDVAVADPDSDRPVLVPVVIAYTDPAAWEDRARALGGTANALFAGFAARLAIRVGRARRSDGRVELTYPVDDRTANDTRGNSLKSVELTVDPTPVSTDLREVRAGIKSALAQGWGSFQEQERALPLIPFVPKAFARKLARDALGSGVAPVGCAYLGAIDPAVARVDGTDADRFWMRLLVQKVTPNSPELKNGEMLLTAGRICGQLFIAVRCYQPGRRNTRDELSASIRQTLAEFGLTGTIE